MEVVVLGVMVAALAWVRSATNPKARTAPWLWVGLLGLAILWLLRSGGLLPQRPWLDTYAALRALGGVTLVISALLTYRAIRARRRGELLVAEVPRPLDEALAELRRTGRAVRGVFEGRLGAQQEVCSPGGVVCAFYEAEVRQPAAKGRKGPLVSTERGFAQTLWVRGEKGEALVSFSPRQLVAPQELQRCTVLMRLADGAGRAFAADPTPVEAHSFEKVGRKGDRCLVAGEMRAGASPGSYEVRGPGGGPATVIVGEEPVNSGRRALRRSWAHFGVAAALCTLGAMLLAQ
jgi:hypothetical protein